MTDRCREMFEADCRKAYLKDLFAITEAMRGSIHADDIWLVYHTAFMSARDQHPPHQCPAGLTCSGDGWDCIEEGKLCEMERYKIEHDGFTGTVIGSYTTLEGKEGVVLQQDGTRVVHVYGRKWLKPIVAQEGL